MQSRNALFCCVVACCVAYDAPHKLKDFDVVQDADPTGEHIYSLFALDGDRLVSGGGDDAKASAVKVWDIASRSSTHSFQGHESRIRGLCTVRSSTGKTLVASGSSDSKVKIWDLSSGECIRSIDHDDAIYTVAEWSIDKVISGANNFWVRVHNVSTGQCDFHWQANGIINSLAVVSPDALTVLCGLGNQDIELWRAGAPVPDKPKKGSHPPPGPKPAELIRTFKGHNQGVTQVVLLSDHQFASGSWDQTIKVWQIDTGACLRTLRGHTDPVSVLCVLSGHLVSAAETTIMVWNWHSDSGAIDTVEGTHADTINALCVSSSGRLVSAANDSSIKVWH